MIKFGPAGLGSIEDSVNNLKRYYELGIRACEIPFTYGVYMKKNKHLKQMQEIRKTAKELGIQLSIHAPYWINLNSKEKEKIENSKKRILRSCEAGHILGAEKIVFHPGYYGKMEKEESYNNIKDSIIELEEEIKKQKWNVKLCPETTGKINVFGKEEEILNLVEDTGCFFCVDFAHLLARYGGKKSYEEMYEPFKNFKELHCHYSGIEWSDKGERRHKIADEKNMEKLFKVLPNNKKITIISESPNPIEDSIRYINTWDKIKN